MPQEMVKCLDKSSFWPYQRWPNYESLSIKSISEISEGNNVKSWNMYSDDIMYLCWLKDVLLFLSSKFHLWLWFKIGLPGLTEAHLMIQP